MLGAGDIVGCRWSREDLPCPCVYRRIGCLGDGKCLFHALSRALLQNHSASSGHALYRSLMSKVTDASIARSLEGWFQMSGRKTLRQVSSAMDKGSVNIIPLLTDLLDVDLYVLRLKNLNANSSSPLLYGGSLLHDGIRNRPVSVVLLNVGDMHWDLIGKTKNKKVTALFNGDDPLIRAFKKKLPLRNE